MLYEKLKHIYNYSNCNKYFPDSSVDLLYQFIQESLRQRKRNISPYAFATYSGFSLQTSIQFFLYFSNGGIFDVEYFFECSRSTCGNRIYLDYKDLDNAENYIECDECGKGYVVEDIQEFIKAYFRLRPEYLEPPSPISPPQKKDHNSTFQVFKGLPDDLKSKSPSFLSSQFNRDEGDFEDAVTLNQIAVSNVDESGSVIEPAVQTFLDKITMRYR